MRVKPHAIFPSTLAFLLATASFLVPALCAAPLDLPAAARQGLEQLYSGDAEAALATFRQFQREQPDSPLGYLLEANARWWKIYCVSCEVKWGTIDAWKRPRLAADDAYFALADKAVRLAEARIAQSDSAEMRLYAGMGWLLRARLLGLRDERRATARAGVKAREHLLRALQLDPRLSDAYTGLGLYNYYADTLSTLAKILRFFMGLPGGDKKEGLRQLEIAMRAGVLTPFEARFYLAKNLRNYDQKYERAAEILKPLVERYPQNPIFHLILGDINAKLGRNEKAASSFRTALEIALADAACAARVRQLARTALETLSTRASHEGAAKASSLTGSQEK